MSKLYPVFQESNLPGVGFWQCTSCRELQRGTVGHPASCAACGYDPLFEDEATPERQEMIRRTKAAPVQLPTCSQPEPKQLHKCNAKVLVQMEIPMECACELCCNSSRLLALEIARAAVEKFLREGPRFFYQCPNSSIKVTFTPEEQ
jgi:hypothetical protein